MPCRVGVTSVVVISSGGVENVLVGPASPAARSCWRGAASPTWERWPRPRSAAAAISGCGPAVVDSGSVVLGGGYELVQAGGKAFGVTLSAGAGQYVQVGRGGERNPRVQRRRALCLFRRRGRGREPARRRQGDGVFGRGVASAAVVSGGTPDGAVGRRPQRRPDHRGRLGGDLRRGGGGSDHQLLQFDGGSGPGQPARLRRQESPA